MTDYTVPKSLASKVRTVDAAKAAEDAVSECRLILQLLGVRQPGIVDVRLEEIETAYRMRGAELQESGLACSACAEPVTRSYEPGRCYAAGNEPAEMSAHDEAVMREEAFGETESESARDGGEEKQ